MSSASSSEEQMAKRRCPDGAPPAVPFNELYYQEYISADPAATAEWFKQVFGWEGMSLAPLTAGVELVHFIRQSPNMNSHIRKRDSYDSQAVIPYITVDDLDAAIERSTKAGATVCVPKTPVPMTGWFAYLRIPGSIVQAIWQDDKTAPVREADAQPSESKADETATASSNKLSRVGLFSLLVKDYDEAIAFYCGKVGFKVARDVQGQGFRWVTIQAPEQADFSITLMQPTTDDDAALIGRQSGSVPLFVIETSDCKQEHERLVALGVEFVQPPTAQFWGLEALFKDCYGNTVNLLQPTPH